MNKIEYKQLSLGALTFEFVGYSIILIALKNITEQGLYGVDVIPSGQLILLAAGSFSVLIAAVTLLKFIRLNAEDASEQDKRRLSQFISMTFLLALLSQFMYVFAPLALAAGAYAFSFAKNQPKVKNSVVVSIVIAAVASFAGALSVFLT